MSIISILGAGAGLRAVWLWLQASRVEIEHSHPVEQSISDVPELHIMKAETDAFLLEAAMQESCNLNKKAALWTAVSVFLGIFAGFVK